MIKFKLYVFISILCLSSSFAQMKNYSYKSELKGVHSNWHSLVLPKDYFSKCKKDFSDIRIYGITATDTIEAPYVLNTIRSVSSLKVDQKSFTIVNKVSDENGYSVTLVNIAEIPLNKIKLLIKDNNYDYNVRVEGSTNQFDWFEVKDSLRILHIKNKHIDFKHSDLNFEPINFPFIRLTFMNTKNVALQDATFKEFIEQKKHYDNHESTYSIEEDIELKQTIVHVKLPYKTPIAKVSLAIDSEFDYYRTMRLEALQDSVITEKGVIYHYKSLYQQHISSFKNEFKDFGYQRKNDFVQQLKITIDNYDNTPLLIKGIEVQSNPIELKARFDNLKATYYLVSGSKKSNNPYYDIINFKNQIPKELTRLKVGTSKYIGIISVANIFPRDSFFTNKLLWGLLVLIIAFIGFFTYKMLKEK